MSQLENPNSKKQENSGKKHTARRIDEASQRNSARVDTYAREQKPVPASPPAGQEAPDRPVSSAAPSPPAQPGATACQETPAQPNPAEPAIRPAKPGSAAQPSQPTPAGRDKPAEQPFPLPQAPIDSKTLQLLIQAYKYELSASNFYEKLSRMEPDKFKKILLREICLNAKKHLKMMAYLNKLVKNDIDGISPAEQEILSSCGRNYELCMYRELDIFDFYRKIFFALKDASREIHDILYEIMSDKHTHAIKLERLCG
ncbi:MAG: hypothetical protein LBS62_02130 [Clostridiales bacterium]|jgi:rubrerythrin|nr:hypothetical protein [Clostridiales bacterium]